jgi:uncharacterized membrane protein YecN with MAPEG domain
MSIFESEQTIYTVLETMVMAPVEHPELLPTLLPIIFGGIVIELYFGKFSRESLGWNTSVGNAIIWVTTAVTLMMTTELSQGEMYATYGLLFAGIFVAYMDFFHKWPETIAFVVSSSGIVYTWAYIMVILIKTDIVVTETTLKASGIFFFAVMGCFKVIQFFETSRDDEFSMDI